MSDSFLNDYLRTRQRVDQLERIEGGGGGSAASVYLTLTRTNTLTIATTGTIVTWESEVRGNGFTWSGSGITIPDDGYYVIDLTYDINSAAVMYADIYVNTTNVSKMSQYYGVGTRQRSTAMRYFSASDILEIRLVGILARTMQVTAYDTTGESPFLHIVKVA